MRMPAPPEDTDNTLDAALLQLIARQGQRLPLPIFLAAILIAWLASYPGWPSPPVACWVAAVGALLLVRRRVLGLLPALHRLPLRRRMHVVVGLNAMNGIVISCCLLFFPPAATLPLSIASMVLVGLCAGAVATTAGSRPLFVAYALPVMGALVLRWLASAGTPGSQPYAYATAIILALFGVVLLSLANDAFRLFCESFNIRLQQAELNAELRLALESAEAASRAKTRFLASASHDLRQPIHTLSLFSASLAMRPLDDVTRDISHHIDLAIESLATQLDALLDISKLDAGIVTVTMEQVDLAALAHRIAEQYAPIAALRGLRIACEADAATVVASDAVLLARVVGNLVDNAIKYTLRGGLALSVHHQGGVAALVVVDSGIGVAEPEQAHIFEEFYQIDNPERDRNKGLGLGLAIVGRTADLLGIRVEMVSRPGWGTGFYLFFPHVAAPVAAVVKPTIGVGGRLARCHVLVVDDDEGVREGMRTLLQSLGARVTLAEGETDALAAVRAVQPDVLLSDLRLRGAQSGIALITRVRSLQPGMPALLISGDTSPERLREAHAAGIGLLHKPVMPGALQRALDDLTLTRSDEGETHD